jgi:hypothetical protein
VITDRSNQLVVTAFRQGVRPDRAQAAERNFIRQELKATMSSIPVESIPVVALKIAGKAKKKTLKDKDQRRQQSRDQKVHVLCYVVSASSICGSYAVGTITRSRVTYVVEALQLTVRILEEHEPRCVCACT